MKFLPFRCVRTMPISYPLSFQLIILQSHGNNIRFMSCCCNFCEVIMSRTDLFPSCLKFAPFRKWNSKWATWVPTIDFKEGSSAHWYVQTKMSCISLPQKRTRTPRIGAGVEGVALTLTRNSNSNDESGHLNSPWGRALCGFMCTYLLEYVHRLFKAKLIQSCSATGMRLAFREMKVPASCEWYHCKWYPSPFPLS